MLFNLAFQHIFHHLITPIFLPQMYHDTFQSFYDIGFSLFGKLICIFPKHSLHFSYTFHSWRKPFLYITGQTPPLICSERNTHTYFMSYHNCNYILSYVRSEAGMNFCLHSFLGTMEVRQARHKRQKIKSKNVDSARDKL